MERRGFSLILILLKSLVHNTLLLFRHNPKSISLNLWVWFIVFIGTYWELLFGMTRSYPSRSISPIISHPVLLVGAFLWIWARISLGRSFGVLPAKREIVVRGAYRWVRHPLYTASFITLLGFLLDHFSLINVVLLSFGVLFMVVKAELEESFLLQDESYRNYCLKVSGRFFPRISDGRKF